MDGRARCRRGWRGDAVAPPPAAVNPACGGVLRYAPALSGDRRSPGQGSGGRSAARPTLSEGGRAERGVAGQERVELAGDVALQAAEDLRLAQALGPAARG